MDTLRRSEDTQRKVDQVSEQLQKLTEQLNQFKPVTIQTVGEVQTQMSGEFQQRLVVQTEKIDKLSESVSKSQKSAQDSAELLQTLLVGMENMGENFKNLREDMVTWQTDYQNAEKEYEQMQQELLEEVSLSVPVVSGPKSVAVNPQFTSPQNFEQQTSLPQSVNVPQLFWKFSGFRIALRVGHCTGVEKAISWCPYSASYNGI